MIIAEQILPWKLDAHDCAETIEKLLKTSDVDVADEEVENLFLFTKRKTYVLRYRARDARRTQRKLTLCRCSDAPPDKARALARDAIMAVAAGGDPAKDRRRQDAALTIESMFEARIAHMRAQGRANAAECERVLLKAANNAAAAGVLMPLLTLGIPTSATAAIMLSAFEGYGIQTGPQLFSQQGGLVWTLIASLYIGNVILLILNLPLVTLWVKLLKIPPPWLYAGIIVISTAGVYGAGNSVFNVGMLFLFGLLGYLMRRFDFPAAPLIVGLILAPMAEQSMRQALTISQGEWSTFFTRPLSGSLMAVSALLLIVPPKFKRWRAL
jgi:hypothetical protein